MKKNSYIHWVFGCLLVLGLGSCKKEDLASPDAPRAVNINKAPDAANGKGNPFALANMQKALENLQKKSTASASPGASAARTAQYTMSATHEYYRVRAVDVEGLTQLDALGIEISEQPYDESTTAPEDPTTVDFPWLYTVVPAGYQLPGNLEQEKIQDLFLFSEDDGDSMDDPWEPNPGCQPYWDPSTGQLMECPVQRSTRSVSKIRLATEGLKKAGISPQALYNEALRLTGNTTDLLPEAAGKDNGANRTTARYYASGRLTVDETKTQTVVPVRNVLVKARRWFKMGDTQTDANGNFYINTPFRAAATILVKFKSDWATTRGISNAWKLWQYVFPIKQNMGTYFNGNMQGISYQFSYNANPSSSQAMNFVAATTFNTLWFSRQYSAARNLPTPPSQLNIWLSSDITQDAASPMLRFIANTSLVSQAIDFFLVGSGLPQVALIKRILQKQLPDITCRFGGQAYVNTSTFRSDQVSSTFFHELAHAQHYTQVGNNYWTSFISEIVQRGGYGTQPNGIISVSEGWANYQGSTFMSQYYSTLPNYSQSFLIALDEQGPNRTSIPYLWFAYGLYYDMEDNSEISGFAVDNVNNYTMTQVFAGLKANTTSITPFVQYQSQFAPAGPAFQQLYDSYRSIYPF